ncbi:bifunctional adenosylcobinamide kinase/adenosylcobinamide-phosphate guanylyltransferase [Halalkalibacterium ligniniphilum]|uniref:bifunctional adenosylcobinamide kinase/adenosylcobinamide-phosphate guanylyltransferase n=1 Tax=Halalkalibacterium ligniniphilum TaxID=1134413 RepID=UPI0013764369|nr:bifunctional adenosylcobinamide kinase/adenosylcobinamide-phosphate guanylyltransferase [Halalkalibacterium ligniniphilum]
MWYNAYKYKDHNKRVPLSSATAKMIVVSGLECFIRSFLKDESPRHSFSTWLDDMLVWEGEEEERQLILIGNEIGKGIVPYEKEERQWRDVVGWCYQDIVGKADRVDQIWYGLPQRLK